MKGRVLHFESPDHREIDLLLPWYASGAMPQEERARVEAHLSECARCQRELEWLREVQAAADDSPAESEAEVEQAFQHLRGRLHARPGQRARKSLRRVREDWLRAPAWTRWALAAQLALCVALAGALLAAHSPAPYHTLGASSAPQTDEARLAVVFDPEMSEDRMRTLLQACDARVVDGPTATGAYVLAVPRARADAALATLRGAPGVSAVATLSPADRR